MSIGSESIRRAAGAIGKMQEETKDPVPFRRDCALAEIPVAALAGQEGDGCGARLAESIAAYGVLCPVLVLRKEDGFLLLDGKARLSAAKALGLTGVPAVVLSLAGEKADKAAGELATGKDSLNEMHEAKFRAIAKIGDDLPTYLL